MFSTQNMKISNIWGLWQDTLAGDSGWMLWQDTLAGDSGLLLAAGLAGSGGSGWLGLAVSGGPPGAPYGPEPTPVWRPNLSELDPRTEHVVRRQIMAYVRYCLTVLT